MVEKNTEYTVKIESVSSDGSGVGHIDGFTVFVPYTAEGDIVLVKTEDVQKRFARARLLEVVTPSADRQDADCPTYGQCGGCQLRHIRYEKQLEIKQCAVENAMRRLGGFKDFTVDTITGTKRTSRYRNKVTFPVGQTGGETVCGFYKPKSHDIIPLRDCVLCDSLNAQIIDAVLNYMRDNCVHAIRRIFTRKSFATGKMMVVITSTVRSLPKESSLIKRVRAVSDKVAGIILNVNNKGAPFGGENVTLWGKSVISDTLCDTEFIISPDSFFQINPEQTEKLYRKVLQFAEIDEDTTVMDIYCGIGTISLCAAKKAKSVIGVEIVKQAIEDAKENAKLNGITNAEFYAESAENIVPGLIENKKMVDVVILDPPRKGSDKKTLTAIIKSGAKRVVYVSCNPATLARDVKFLCDSGYKISGSAVFDLFPHTCHVETVIKLEN